MNATLNKTVLIPANRYYREPQEVMILRLTLETAIAFAGVVGNILVCIVVASKRLRGRSSMHFYLLNLALADIGVLVFLFPVGVIKERLPSWPLGRFGCLFLCPLIDTFFGASIWSITSIAFQRHQNIVKNKELHYRRSTKCIICEIILIWVAAFLIISLPLFFVYRYDDTSGDRVYCSADWRKAPHPSLIYIYIISLVVFSYILPLAVITWTYFGIWREIRKSIQFHQSLQKQLGGAKINDRRSGENSRARKILTPIVVTFAISMLPMNVYRLLAIFWKPLFLLRHFWTFYNAVLIITFTNSAVNPIIYSVVSKDFRKAFYELIFKAGKHHTNHWSYFLSRSKSDGNRHSSYNKQRKTPQPAVIGSAKEWPDASTLKETIL